MSVVPLSKVARINPTAPKGGGGHNEFAFLPMAAVHSDLLEATPDEVLSAQDVKAGLTYFEDGDILVAKITPCFENGKTALVCSGGLAGFGSTEFHVVRPDKDLDRRYLAHFLRQPAIRFAGEKRMTGSAGQKRVPRKFLEELEIPLPSLDEQKRIAAILDQADGLRHKRQRALDRLNRLGRAIFHEMFGDPKTNPRGLRCVALGEMADFYSGNSLPNGEPFKGQSDGHLLLKVSDLNHEQNQQDIVCAAAWSPVPGSRAGTCPPNALIFPKRGGAIGTNKKRWLRRSAILDPNLMGVHPNETDLTMPFLNGWFQTFNLSDIASGSSVPQLNKQDLAPLEIPLPPIDEQTEYAERMDALSATRRSAAIALGLDNQLFTSLQHRAFRGEL